MEIIKILWKQKYFIQRTNFLSYCFYFSKLNPICWMITFIIEYFCFQLFCEQRKITISKHQNWVTLSSFWVARIWERERERESEKCLQTHPRSCQVKISSLISTNNFTPFLRYPGKSLHSKCTNKSVKNVGIFLSKSNLLNSIWNVSKLMETDWEASLLSLALARALYDALTPLRSNCAIPSSPFSSNEMTQKSWNLPRKTSLNDANFLK